MFNLNIGWVVTSVNVIPSFRDNDNVLLFAMEISDGVENNIFAIECTEAASELPIDNYIGKVITSTMYCGLNHELEIVLNGGEDSFLFDNVYADSHIEKLL